MAGSVSMLSRNKEQHLNKSLPTRGLSQASWFTCSTNQIPPIFQMSSYSYLYHCRLTYKPPVWASCPSL